MLRQPMLFWFASSHVTVTLTSGGRLALRSASSQPKACVRIWRWMLGCSSLPPPPPPLLSLLPPGLAGAWSFKDAPFLQCEVNGPRLRARRRPGCSSLAGCRRRGCYGFARPPCCCCRCCCPARVCFGGAASFPPGAKGASGGEEGASAGQPLPLTGAALVWRKRLRAGYGKGKPARACQGAAGAAVGAAWSLWVVSWKKACVLNGVGFKCRRGVGGWGLGNGFCSVSLPLGFYPGPERVLRSK